MKISDRDLPLLVALFPFGSLLSTGNQDCNTTHAEVPQVSLVCLRCSPSTRFYVDAQPGRRSPRASVRDAAPAPGSSERGSGRFFSPPPAFCQLPSPPRARPGAGRGAGRALPAGAAPERGGGGAGAARWGGRSRPRPPRPGCAVWQRLCQSAWLHSARPVLPVLYPRRLLVSLLRCEPGARPPLPLRLWLGECAGGGARGSAERRGAERSWAAAWPAPAAGSPGAGPRVGPGPPRWTLPRASPASCSAARSPCPPAPCGAPGTQVGALRRDAFGAARPALPRRRRRPVPAARPSQVAARRPAAFGSPWTSSAATFAGFPVVSCERQAGTGTGAAAPPAGKGRGSARQWQRCAGARSPAERARPGGQGAVPGLPRAGWNTWQLVCLLLRLLPGPSPPSKTLGVPAETAPDRWPWRPHHRSTQTRRTGGSLRDVPLPCRFATCRPSPYRCPSELSRRESMLSLQRWPPGSPQSPRGDPVTDWACRGAGSRLGGQRGAGPLCRGRSAGSWQGGQAHAAVWYFGEEKASLSELCTLHAGELSACTECSVHLPYVSVCCANE